MQLPARFASLRTERPRQMGRRRGGGGGGGGGGRGGGRGRGRDEEDDLHLHKAARSGDSAAAESLCESNPLAVNSRDRLSRTPYASLSLQILPFSLPFPHHLSREEPSSHALCYGYLLSLLRSSRVHNYTCSITLTQACVLRCGFFL
jgi:hypothetical protein